MKELLESLYLLTHSLDPTHLSISSVKYLESLEDTQASKSERTHPMVEAVMPLPVWDCAIEL